MSLQHMQLNKKQQHLNLRKHQTLYDSLTNFFLFIFIHFERKDPNSLGLLVFRAHRQTLLHSHIMFTLYSR